CLCDYSDEYLLVGAEVCSGFFLNKKTFQVSYVRIEYRENSFIDPLNAASSPSSYSNWIHHFVKKDSLLYASFLIGGYVYEIHEGKPFRIPSYTSAVSPAFSAS